MAVFLMVVGAVLALGLGFYLGFGRFGQSSSEIERALDEKGHRRRAKRHFMYLDYLRPGRGKSRRRDRERERGRFRLEAPEERKEER